jgi:hypothetical protein
MQQFINIVDIYIFAVSFWRWRLRWQWGAIRMRILGKWSRRALRRRRFKDGGTCVEYLWRNRGADFASPPISPSATKLLLCAIPLRSLAFLFWEILDILIFFFQKLVPNRCVTILWNCDTFFKMINHIKLWHIIWKKNLGYLTFSFFFFFFFNLITSKKEKIWENFTFSLFWKKKALEL